MKLFTRIFLLFAALWLPFASVYAATITVQVGDNFYRGPNTTSTITIAANDILVFQNVGNSTHPTVSTTGAWLTFIISPSSTIRTFGANSFAPGTYPFYCSAHGTAVSGQTGTLIVTQALAATPESSVLALSLFPNPSKGLVTVQMKQQKAGADYKLRVSNIIGQEVRNIALKPELTEAGLPIDLSSLPNGIYFYSLLVDGKVTTTKRLVLQN